MNWFKKIFAKKEQKVWWYLQDNVEYKYGEYKVFISAETSSKKKYLKDLMKRASYYLRQKRTYESGRTKSVFYPIIGILGSDFSGIKVILNETIGEQMLKEKQ